MIEPTVGLAHGLTNYGDKDFSLYLRRSFAQSMGLSRAMLGRPVVGIAYTASGFNNCHRHFPELLDAVKRGVLAAGALPVAFPTISLGEVFLSPTSLKFRNLMAMDTEEMIRAQPMDAVVLMGGCDKTVPAQLMGAVSAGRPAIMLVGGPMMTGRHRGERLGACTDCRRFWARYRAGAVDAAEISEVEGKLAVTAGTCAVMGTASTMACIVEALGMMLPGTAAIPAVHADRLRAAAHSPAARDCVPPDITHLAPPHRTRACRCHRPRRRLGCAPLWRSRIGSVLDPIADKLFVAVAFGVVLFSGRLTWFEIVAVLARDIVATVAFVSSIATGAATSVTARLGGKAVTLLQMITLVVFVLAGRSCNRGLGHGCGRTLRGVGLRHSVLPQTQDAMMITDQAIAVLDWSSDMVFTAGAPGQATMTLDGNSRVGTSPVTALLWRQARALVPMW